MPTVIDELVVLLTLNAESLKQESNKAKEELKKTREEAEKTAKTMNERGAQASEFFSRIKIEALSLFGVLLGGYGIKEVLANTVTGLSSIGREAQNIGMSVPDLAAFRQMIEANGGSADAAGASFLKLADRMKTAAIFGDPQLRGALSTIGIPDLNHNPLEIYMAYVRYVESHPAMGRILGHLLGFEEGGINNAYKGVDKVKKDFAEALSHVPSEEMSDRMRILQHDFENLTQAMTNLGTAVVDKLEPAIDVVVKKLTEIVGAQPIIWAGMIEYFKFIFNPFKGGAVDRRPTQGGSWLERRIRELLGIENSLPNDPNYPRGIRNNNPTNLSFVPGQGAIGSDGRFGIYGTAEEGIRAAENQLLLYQERDGLNTIRGIITKWAPPSENDTASYIAAVSSMMGVGADDTLNLRNRGTATALLNAMIKRETGRYVEAATIGAGVDQALRMSPDAVLSSSPAARLSPSGAQSQGRAHLSNQSNTHINVGDVVVNTGASTLTGVGTDLGKAINDKLIGQANRGLY